MQKNKEKIKVLQIAGGFRDNVNGKPVSGGVPSFLYNYYMKIDKTKIHFDFMAIRNQCFEPYREDLEKSGSSLYTLEIQSNGIKKFFAIISKLRKFLHDNQYDAVHINMGSFFPVLTCAIAAKKAGIKNILAHSHSSGMYSKKKRFFVSMCSPLLTYFANQYCACSLVAAENLFSKRIIERKKYRIIRNAIDEEKYSYNEKLRDAVRSELNITEEIVVGHVGRFVEVKNHDFLIDFFAEFNKKISNSKLILVGDGEQRNIVEEKVENLGLAEQVIFMGQQKKIENFYQAMDIFVMPSLLEGFPIVAMEAQSTGLPCYVSSSITEEAKVTDHCKFFHLIDGAENLAETVVEDYLKFEKRKDASQHIIDAGYSLKSNLSTFESLYL